MDAQWLVSVASLRWFPFFFLPLLFFSFVCLFLIFKISFHSPAQLTGVNLCLCSEKGMGEGVRNVTCRSHQLWGTTKWIPQARHRRDCGRTGYVSQLVCLPYSKVKMAGVSATCQADSSAEYHAVRARTLWSELEVNCVGFFLFSTEYISPCNGQS